MGFLRIWVRTKPVRFLIQTCPGMIFAMTSEQKTLIRFDPPDPGFAVVNDRVSFTTEENERVVSVHGIFSLITISLIVPPLHMQ